MQKTKYFQLNKPQLSDFANIEEAINPSMDIIDTKLKELEDSKVSATDGTIANVNLPAAWVEHVDITDINQIGGRRSLRSILSAIIGGLKFVHSYFKSTKIVWMRVNGFTGNAPYTLRIDVPGIKAGDTPVISHSILDGVTDANVIKGAWKSYSCIDKIEIFDGYMIVKCFRKRPMQDILLAVKGG